MIILATKEIQSRIRKILKLRWYNYLFSQLQAIVAIGKGTDNGEFIFCDSDLVYDEGIDIDPSEYDVKAQERAAMELKRRHDYLVQVGCKSLLLVDGTSFFK